MCVYSHSQSESYSHYKSYSHSLTSDDGRSQCSSSCSYTCCTGTTTTSTGDRCGGGSLTSSKKRCGMMSKIDLLHVIVVLFILGKGQLPR